MKKTNKLFFTMCMAGAFALILGSCKKNEETPKVTVNLPAFEEEVEERAYIDFSNGALFTWNAGDEMAIYRLALDGSEGQKGVYSADADGDGQTSAHFSYQSGEVLGTYGEVEGYSYFGFYPAAKVSGDEFDGCYETFTVDATQEYTIDPNQNPTLDPAGMALAADRKSLEGDVALNHIFGVLRLKLKGTGVVTKIVVEDKNYSLSGNVSMKLNEVNMATFSELQQTFVESADPENDEAFVTAWAGYKGTLDYSAKGTGKTMTLNVPSVQLNASEFTPFYIGLRPGALKYGYKFYFYVEGANEPYVYENKATWNSCIQAGYIKGITFSNIN